MIFKSTFSSALILVFFFITTIKGAEYKCAADLNINTCYLEGQENKQQVIYMGTCPKGQTCEKINDIGKCLVSPSKAVIGSTCSADIECLTGLCKNNICTAPKAIGESCTSIEDCPINANCTGTGSKTCTQYSDPNGTCTVDEDCIVGYACGDTKKCEKMFEKAIGTECNNGKLCETARALAETGGSRKCIQVEEKDSDCLQRNKDKNSSDLNYYCDPKYIGITSAAQGYAQCQVNYKGNYICLTKKTETLNRYISLFKEVYATLSEDAKKSRLTDRNYLNNDTLKEAFEAFDQFLVFRPESECAASTDNDDGNDPELEDNENENDNDNKNGSFLDSSSFISVSLSVIISLFMI